MDAIHTVLAADRPLHRVKKFYLLSCREKPGENVRTSSQHFFSEVLSPPSPLLLPVLLVGALLTKKVLWRLQQSCARKKFLCNQNNPTFFFNKKIVVLLHRDNSTYMRTSISNLRKGFFSHCAARFKACNAMSTVRKRFFLCNYTHYYVAAERWENFAEKPQ